MEPERQATGKMMITELLNGVSVSARLSGKTK